MNLLLYFFVFPIFNKLFKNDRLPSFKINMNMNNDYFLKLLDYNLELTKNLELKTIQIDERFEKGNTKNDSGMIYNYCFTNKHFRKVRFTYFDGNSKFQYFGLVFHPIYNYDAPIFNFEIILCNNEKTVYTLNMVKMDNSKIYNEKYVKPFMKIKNKYPELKENLAVRLSGYNVFGNFISEAILLGKFMHNNNNKKINSTDEIYNNIVIPSFKEYLSTYLDFFDKPIYINLKEEVENIKNRQKLFDLKKAFVESRYDIRKCFDDEWYNAMLYDFFYEIEKE